MQFLILVALVPSLVVAFLIYRADKKEKEPIDELLKAFSMGVLSIILTLMVSFFSGIHKLIIDSNNLIQVFIYSFICISLVEEVSKWLCSYVFLRKNKNFNYMFDGIVYTVFVALGFATVENLLYTINGGMITAIIRSVTTVPAHAFFGIFSGYYISLSKKEQFSHNVIKEKQYLMFSIFIPILLHGFYDFCLLTHNYIFYIIYLVFVVSLYAISIYNIKRMMKMENKFDNKKKVTIQ